ncbi:MAG: DUF86 domain-containing protein [Saprospiraceae bacterium]|nr:MAG: DUF86 domain-containing protein [Saprospiraceae bacterium]
MAKARHIIVHAYDTVDNQSVWGILTKHLKVLEGEVKQLLLSG